MKAIILAAGEGAHLSPFSETRPISMIGVAGRTMLDNTFGLLKSAGINDIFIVVRHKKDKLIERLQQQDHNGLNLHYVEQKRKLGIGHAVMQIKNNRSKQTCVESAALSD